MCVCVCVFLYELRLKNSLKQDQMKSIFPHSPSLQFTLFSRRYCNASIPLVKKVINRRYDITRWTFQTALIYLCIYRDCHFLGDGHLLDLIRVPMGVRVTPQVKCILACPTACVINDLAAFSIYTIPVHHHITSQTHGKPK